MAHCSQPVDAGTSAEEIALQECNSLFSELPSAIKVSWFKRPIWKVFPAHPSSFANDFPHTVFVNRTLDGFQGAVNRWLLPLVMFFFSCRMCFGVANAIYKQFCFFHLGMCYWF